MAVDQDVRTPATEISARASRRRWLGLAVLCAGQLLVEIDDAVVNLALPSVQRSLDVAPQHLAWVVNAYLLAFGGFLLLGGRLADRYGRRRVLLGGLGLFVAASLLGTAAWATLPLIVARAAQGLAAALLAPAAMAMLVATFPDPAQRARAMAVWGAVTGMGVTAGLLAGGLVTDRLGWRWVFLLNAVAAAVVAACGAALLRESRLPRRTPFDVAGAVLVTAGLVVLVRGVDLARESGWLAGTTVLELLAAVLLLAAFVVRQHRAAHPLLPLALLRRRTLAVADGAAALVAAGMIGSFFFLSLYLQQVLAFSPLRTAVAYLPLIAALLAGAAAGQAVQRRSPAMALAGGCAATAGGLLLLVRIGDGGGYTTDVLPALGIIGSGLGLAFVALTTTAVDGIGDGDSGLASGLYNTALQLGGGVGLALLAGVASSRAASALATGATPVRAASEGYAAGAGAAAAIVLAGALLAVVGLRPPPRRGERA